jgi:hypothetical protein
MKQGKYMLGVCLFLLLGSARPQQARIMFYNVENLFDVEDDPLTDDSEFLPDAGHYWTYERYWRKVVRIYQVISAVDEWDMPVIIGLCEIENRDVLEKLVYDTPLSGYDYRIIHRDSPDARGIDVALLYRKGIFTPDTSEWLRIIFKDGGETREILKVSGRLWKDVRVHFYVNHWPSRSGGAVSSAPRRMQAALTLKSSLDSLFSKEPAANVFLMGDFNDEPGDKSLQMLITTDPAKNPDSTAQIVNLSVKTRTISTIGTLTHQGAWNVFDQFLVSVAVKSGSNGISLRSDQTEIFFAPFLLESDDSYFGDRPFRTYIGPSYHNGFSDHLPVSVVVEKIEVRSQESGVRRQK